MRSPISYTSHLHISPLRERFERLSDTAADIRVITSTHDDPYYRFVIVVVSRLACYRPSPEDECVLDAVPRTLQRSCRLYKHLKAILRALAIFGEGFTTIVWTVLPSMLFKKPALASNSATLVSTGISSLQRYHCVRHKI